MSSIHNGIVFRALFFKRLPKFVSGSTTFLIISQSNQLIELNFGLIEIESWVEHDLSNENASQHENQFDKK